MEEQIINQVIQLAALVAVIGVGYAVAWVRGKIINGKLGKLIPQTEGITNELQKHFFDVCRNTFETFVKPLKQANQWNDTTRQQAVDHAFDSLLKVLPDFVKTGIKRLHKDWQDALRQKLQNFYELNKDKIVTAIKSSAFFQPQNMPQ